MKGGKSGKEWENRLFFFFKDYLLERESEQACKWGEGQKERERENLKQTPHGHGAWTRGSIPRP